MKILLVIAIVAGLLATACVPKAEEVIERGMELGQDMEGMVEIPEEETASESEAEREYASWASLELPAQFPEYSDGSILKPHLWNERDWYPKLLGVEGSNIEAIEDYIQRAQGAGYSLQWEREVMGDEDMGWAVSKETDDEYYNIIINYFEEEDGISDYILLILDFREK